jgi:hypothetical protein
MSGRGTKWLMGCSLGCAVPLVIVLGLLAIGWHHHFKDAVTGFRSAGKTQEVLHETMGGIDDFAPRWDGGLQAERLTAFLAIQQQIAPMGIALVEEALDGRRAMNDSKGRLGRFWHTLTEGNRLGIQLARFLQARSEAMLAEGMNPGEYLYLHSLIYHCWLGYDPGQEAAGYLESIHHGADGLRIQVGGNVNLADDPEIVLRQLRQSLNRRHQIWLQSMLQAAPATLSAVEEAWVDQVRKQKERLEQQPESMPWTDSFPPAWQHVLEPLRAAFIRTWSAECNLIELILQKGPCAPARFLAVPDRSAGHGVFKPCSIRKNRGSTLAVAFRLGLGLLLGFVHLLELGGITLCGITLGGVAPRFAGFGLGLGGGDFLGVCAGVRITIGVVALRRVALGRVAIMVSGFDMLAAGGLCLRLLGFGSSGVAGAATGLLIGWFGVIGQCTGGQECCHRKNTEQDLGETLHGWTSRSGVSVDLMDNYRPSRTRRTTQKSGSSRNIT